MSRSGYCDEPDSNWDFIKWRGMVASASRGKRGQQFFKDLLAALDAMPQKREMDYTPVGAAPTVPEQPAKEEQW